MTRVSPRIGDPATRHRSHSSPTRAWPGRRAPSSCDGRANSGRPADPPRIAQRHERARRNPGWGANPDRGRSARTSSFTLSVISWAKATGAGDGEPTGVPAAARVSRRYNPGVPSGSMEAAGELLDCVIAARLRLSTVWRAASARTARRATFEFARGVRAVRLTRVSDLQVPLTDDRTTYPYEWLLTGAIDWWPRCVSNVACGRRGRGESGPRRSTVGATRPAEGSLRYGKATFADPVNKKVPDRLARVGSKPPGLHPPARTPKYGASRRHWIGRRRRARRRLPRTSTAADELSGHPVPQVTPPYLTPARGGRCCRLPRAPGSAGPTLAQLRRITPIAVHPRSGPSAILSPT